jgi:hypothetical protein
MTARKFAANIHIYKLHKYSIVYYSTNNPLHRNPHRHNHLRSKINVAEHLQKTPKVFNVLTRILRKFPSDVTLSRIQTPAGFS